MSTLTINFFLLFTLIFALSNAQNDGRYRAIKTIKTTKKPVYTLEGRYLTNKNDGRYNAGNDGKYRGNNGGRYRPSNDGKYNGDNGRYVHQDNPYVHDARSGGEYTGNNGSYKPDKNRIGGSGGSGGSGSGSGNVNVNKGQGIVTKRPTIRPPTTKLTTQKPALPVGTGSGVGKNGWRILYLFDKEEKDGYHYIYETENGIKADEEGHIVALPSGQGLQSKGFFEYTGDDGYLYRVDYVADDAGFVPKGNHIPETPQHVLRLLEYLALNAKK